MLLRLLDAGRFITYRSGPGQVIEAYDVFARAGKTGARKAVLSRS